MNNNICIKAVVASCFAYLPTLSPASNAALEEVIVTAQRRAEGLQDLPLSISALSGADIRKLKMHNITDIAGQIPNVSIATPYAESQPSFSVRGVSMSDFSQNQSSPIAMYVDEVYKGVGALQALQLFDLERIEVLRGPQGTLYGKNATGGAVNILSTSPDLSGEGASYIAAGIGTFNRFESDGAIDLALVPDTLGARLAYTYARSEGWVDNEFAGSGDTGELEDYAVRLSLKYAPTDSLDAVLKYSRSRSDMPNGYEVLATNIGTGGVGYVTGYDRHGLDYFDSELDRQSKMSIDNTSVILALNWYLSESLSLASVSSYDEGRWTTREDADGSPFAILHSDFGSDVRALSQDFRLVSAFSGPANFVLGLYGYDEDLDADVTFRTYYQYAGDFNDNGVNDCLEDFITGCRNSNAFTQHKQSYAGYFQGTYDLTDQATLTLGVRYTQDKSELENYRAAIGYYDPALGTEVRNALATIDGYGDSLDDEKWSFRFVVDYALSADVATYLSYTTGYRNSAFNGQAFFDPGEITIAAPEEVGAWELGAKSEWFGRSLRLNGAIFHYRYSDQQFLDVTPNLLQILVNADRAEVFGGELELTKVFGSRLQASIGLGLLDTEYTQIELRGEDLSGNQLINAPQLTFNARVAWTLAELEAGHVDLTVDAIYSDEQYFDAFNSRHARQAGYWVSNARLAFSTRGNKLELGAWIKNIANEEYVTSLLDLQASFNFDYAHRGPARAAGLDLRYRF
ncbi:TonB-dependent receptor [Parahaliea mediterranea]|uniref:TonB-dependent receptor n=1 Tax=Parahaliea mediterranea TaxID=651086 RepID=A0A939DGE6_9GAMM|nr:TonB-dependent receptor [Parahaliea mediterranea]MBN7797589.1 TonB-dependent receptor [Parahaliea mediterranea]